MHNQRDARIDVVDALREFALAGIVLAHTWGHFIAGPSWESSVSPSGIDFAIQWVRSQLVASKFYSLFALLFGMSFSMMISPNLIFAEQGNSF